MRSQRKNNRFSLSKISLTGFITAQAILFSPVAESDPLSTQTVISGRVIPRTCAFDQTSIMINLDELRRDEITDGATYAETSVFLSVSSCSPEISNITITPTGTPDTSNTLLFKNTADPLNSAEGVALRLMDQDGVVLPPSGELSVPVNITQGNGSYNFRAGYAGNGTSITSGYFSAVVSLKLDYK